RIIQRLSSNLCDFVISDHGIERSCQQQRIRNIRSKPEAIDVEIMNEPFAEDGCTVSQNPDRLQQIIYENWLRNVEFEISGGCCGRDRRMISDDLECDLGHDFGNGRISLSWHDRRCQAVVRDNDFSQATT